MDKRPHTLLIACGALAREIAALKRANGWTNLDVRCLPAQLHNRPERIAPAVRTEIQANRARYAKIFVVYADCGTRGELDALLKEEGVERLPGAHCYEFLARPQVFAQLAEAEPGTDRKSTRLNSSHDQISYAVFCLKKKKQDQNRLQRSS